VEKGELATSGSAEAAVPEAAPESAAPPAPGREARDRRFAVFFLASVFAVYVLIGYALYLLVSFTVV
jgi:hypothetical protein